jgi:glycerophosphoryl diester phosphodiesterase
VVAEFRRLDATLDLGLLVEDGPDYVLPPNLLTAVRDCGADFLAPDVSLLGPATRHVAHAVGRGLSVWTVNDPSTLAALARDPDVAIITTDVPALARAVISAA